MPSMCAVCGQYAHSFTGFERRFARLFDGAFRVLEMITFARRSEREER